MAHRLAADLEAQGRPGIEIRADAFATLNGRPGRRIVASDVNLAAALADGWILPLGP